ncbi:class I SAM-dependent methyltransferase [Gelidibacter pelagius]|uniref:Class I SAM-dependent methyltransferase n=1 Tax=Gelidibacter pelagius TaxID=2819985 RepID=A0ABS3SWA0_9FLAO|nr:class I SAM-dependent methyltransferase [Gelidibacter pelagius]MBO3100022.1 class I SAM-dependent methyltransferase [Gelidibacter pelagius]
MEKEKNIEIHETAFLTSTLRSLNEDLSQDYFAKLWRNPKSDIWIEKYLDRVSSEEINIHCLRNRYFLDTIKKLVDDNNVEVLINFGCGFSMYPFLLDERLVHIEIDKPEIIDYKKSKLTDWQNSDTLPKRNIHFIAVDFSEDYKHDLLTQIFSIKNNKPCFILIEGVLFFLDREETDKLFDFFDTIQKPGDFIGSVSFQDTLKESLAFRKLLDLLNQIVSNTKESDYQTIEDDYYRSQPAYQLIDHQDYFSLSAKYGNVIKLNKEEILNENFYLLKKSN